MKNDFLTTKEVASLLRLKERKVYDLVAKNEIPFVKATGKLLFPKNEITSWVKAKGLVASDHLVRPQVVLGSHDPLLEWAIDSSGCGLASLVQGSLDGLKRFVANEGLLCGIHIENEHDVGWNLEAANTYLSSSPCVLVHWVKRDRGLVVSKDSQIHAIDNLRNARLVKRQSAAGSQIALERRLSEAGISQAEINYVREAKNETEAALAIVEGEADVSFGLRCFADRYKLNYVPVCVESFDIVIDRHAYFEPPVQKLLSFTRSEAFKKEAARYSGFDISETGVVRFNSAI